MTRWTEQDLKGRTGIKAVSGAVVAQAQRSKMGNIPTVVNGFRFQSTWEAAYYKRLLMEGQAGSLRWFTRQVPFWLEGGVKYVADFLELRDSGLVVVDTSGHLTRTKINKLKGMKDRYGILVLLKFKDGTTKTIDDIGGNRHGEVQ